MLPQCTIASGAILLEKNKGDRKIRNENERRKKLYIPCTKLCEWYGMSILKRVRFYVEYQMHDERLATFDNGVWLVLVSHHAAAWPQRHRLVHTFKPSIEARLLPQTAYDIVARYNCFVFCVCMCRTNYSKVNYKHKPAHKTGVWTFYQTPSIVIHV